MEQEIWLPVVGYEGLYEVSNYGKVRKIGKETFKIPTLRKDGYWSINLWKNNTLKQARLHRLIAQAFIPNPENKPDINHLDAIKTNNNLENLEWCTAKENMQHAAKLGLLRNSGAKKGVKWEKPMSIQGRKNISIAHKGKHLSEQQKQNISKGSKKCISVQHIETGIIYHSQRAAAKAFGISKSTLQAQLVGDSPNCQFVYVNKMDI